MEAFDWKERYGHLIQSAREAMTHIKSGDSILSGRGAVSLSIWSGRSSSMADTFTTPILFTC